MDDPQADQPAERTSPANESAVARWRAEIDAIVEGMQKPVFEAAVLPILEEPIRVALSGELPLKTE